MNLVVRNARVIDPATGRDEIGDLWVIDGKFSEPPTVLPEDLAEINGSGLVAAPGFIDMHVHLREPGQTGKETIASGSRAAAAGGFTTVLAMPNTRPAVDSAGTARWILEQAKRTACIRVLTSGALTIALKGEDLAPIGSLANAGVTALTDDGSCVQNHELMRRAVEYARMFQLPVLDHCQDASLTVGAQVNEGKWSTRLGLPGWPSAAEELIVSRNILLAELCESPIHCQHLSCAGSVQRLREARSRGALVTGEICPHHIALTDDAIQNFDTNAKMNPPLRTEADIEALLEGIADGTVSILCSDHAPHSQAEKEVEFDRAPFGIVGLETEVGLFLDLLIHKRKVIDLPRLVAMFTIEPARLLNLQLGTLTVGQPGDVTLLDLNHEWVVDAEAFETSGRNTPFHGREMKGRPVRTIKAGRTVWSLDGGICL
ncbi:MAG: dihydroorotase [Verrucomicrobiales bacterium]